MVTLGISSKWKHSYSWRSITISCLSDSSSAWFSEYIQVHRGIYYVFKAECRPRVTDCFFLNIAELSWNAFLESLSKVQSFNPDVTEVRPMIRFRKCCHRAPTKRANCWWMHCNLAFYCHHSSVTIGSSLSAKALYIQDP